MNLTDLKKCFHYTADKKILFDHYSVMRKNADGKYRGDCDDYAMTYAWIVCGCNLWSFLKAVFLTSEIRFYRVKTFDGGNHLVGNLRKTDEWFDNWTMNQRPRGGFFHATKHTIRYRQPRVLVAIFLLIGLFTRR